MMCERGVVMLVWLCRVFPTDGAIVVVDKASYNYIRGSRLDLQRDLVRTGFVIEDNPMAGASCGCGASLSLPIDTMFA